MLPMMNERSRTRVLIVDDHPMIRQMVSLACRNHPRMEVVGEASNGAEALELCRRLRPDVLVLDLLIPRLDGIEVARRLQEDGSATRILDVTGADDKASVFEALRVGAAGYVEKTASLEHIVAAIEAVADGTKVFTVEQERQAHEHLGEFARKAWDTAKVLASLTPRERDVLGLIAEGLSTRQIANRLRMSERTAETHIGNIYQKLQVKTRLQALYRAAGLGLVTRE